MRKKDDDIDGCFVTIISMIPTGQRACNTKITIATPRGLRRARRPMYPGQPSEVHNHVCTRRVSMFACVYVSSV